MPKGVYNHKPHSKEIRMKMSKRMKGDNNPTKKLETRLKISKALKGRKITWADKIRDTLLRITPRGKDHHCWKGGKSKDYDYEHYFNWEYKQWRRKVFERDNYTCQDCKVKGYVTAHHIKSWSRYPKLRYKTSNGKTLCKNCHSLTDNYKGRKIKPLDLFLSPSSRS